MELQTLVFNTTTKVAKLYAGEMEKSYVLATFDDVPTVKVADQFYEIWQNDSFDKRYPVLRVPIVNTNMFIKQ